MALPKACAAKCARRPARNASSPTHATSWRSTEAPLAYEMPSKLSSAVVGVGAPRSGATGWVEGRWSAAYPQALRRMANVVHAWVNRVASAVTRVPMYSANDSFSHRSSHQRMVTRSPNHMCAISCAMVVARSSRSASVTAERNT